MHSFFHCYDGNEKQYHCILFMAKESNEFMKNTDWIGWERAETVLISQKSQNAS